MFHVELRQFPTTSRVFNLSAEELQLRFLDAWIAGETVEHEGNHFSPEKAKLKIYEGRALRPDEIGVGRGWGNVTRSGVDVTTRIVEQARELSAPNLRAVATRELKAHLLERGGELGFSDVMALTSDAQAGWRVSERMAVAEQAVWELLHEGAIRLTRAEVPIERVEWEGVVLSWRTWSDDGTGLLLVVSEPAQVQNS